jgi:hypothetical protein
MGTTASEGYSARSASISCRQRNGTGLEVDNNGPPDSFQLQHVTYRLIILHKGQDTVGLFLSDAAYSRR